MADVQPTTDDAGELSQLLETREFLQKKFATGSPVLRSDLSGVLTRLDERIGELKQNPADEERRLLADKTPATRGFVRRSFNRYLEMIAKEVVALTMSVFGPLKEEVAVLRQRLDQLERKDAP